MPCYFPTQTKPASPDKQTQFSLFVETNLTWVIFAHPLETMKDTF